MNIGYSLYKLTLCLGLSFSACAPVAQSAMAQDVAGDPKGDLPVPAAGVVEKDANWPELIPTSAFASRLAMRNAKLSPDGTRFALQTMRRGRSLIAVFDAETYDLVHSMDVGRAEWFNWFRWAGNSRILFSADGNGQSKSKKYLMTGRWATSLSVYDFPTNTTHFIGFREQGFEGDDVLYTDPQGRYVVLSMARRVFGDPSVYRFPLDGRGEGAATLLQDKRKGIDEWWADNEGVVRLGLRHRKRGALTFFYRGSDDEEWISVTKVDKDALAEIDGWDVLSISAGSDMGYALIKGANGLKALREFNYRTGTVGEVVHAHSKRDINGVRFDNDGQLIAATLIDDARETKWFDPTLEKAQSQLESALGSGRVQIMSFADTNRMLVWHGGASDPGAMYVYSPAARKLDLFSEYRPDLNFESLSAMQAVRYTARDGTPIEAYLTLPKGAPDGPKPLIIMPHGGPYGVRDSLTYADDVQLLANRGYAVLQPNFRGSGGHGEKFVELGRGQIGRAMQDDLDDGMDWAVKQGHADPTRVCVVGGSYGGYAALWAAIRNPERYRCAASWAGVTDFGEQLKYDKDYLDRRVGKRLRTRIEGEGTTGDLGAISPVKQIGRLKRPILLAHGERDRRVPFRQFELLRDAAKEAGAPIEELVLGDEGHSFSGPHAERAWYDALTAFLAKHNPSDRPLPPPSDKKKGGIVRVKSM